VLLQFRPIVQPDPNRIKFAAASNGGGGSLAGSELRGVPVINTWYGAKTTMRELIDLIGTLGSWPDIQIHAGNFLLVLWFRPKR